jgi:hypothetical protein
VDRRVEEYARRWGEKSFQDEMVGGVNPSAPRDELSAFTRVFRLSVSPSAAAAYLRMNLDVDVRDVLPFVHVPTLALGRTGVVESSWANVRSSRYLAERIPGARLVEMPGENFGAVFGDQDRLLTELEGFLVDVVQGKAADIEPDRMLATVLFTDIVDATARAAELGDRAWRDLCYGTTKLFVLSSSASAAKSLTRPGMAFSPPSMALPGQFAAAAQSPRPCPSSGFRCGSACTPANAS